MKVRIKFEKLGVVKFIGHLDIMRYFQKAIRRAEIDIAYSTGFSPHQIMSFAAPLGVGLYSHGEYFDIEVHSHQGSEKMLQDLNTAMVPGIKILSVKALPEQVGNAMASVAAAGYTIEWKVGYESLPNLQESVEKFMQQDTIMVTKQTKKSELTLDIKPGIYALTATDTSLYMLVDASSSGNIKPTMVMEALYAFYGQGESFSPLGIQITREDTYTNIGTVSAPKFVPLDAVGVDF